MQDSVLSVVLGIHWGSWDMAPVGKGGWLCLSMAANLGFGTEHLPFSAFMDFHSNAVASSDINMC